MRRIIYLSAGRGAMSPEVVDDILTVSRRNNARDGITGLLAYHDGCFFQSLEGPEDHLTACLTRVRADQRHSGMLILSDRQVDRAVFGQWDMALVPRSELWKLVDASVLSLEELGSAHGRISGDSHVDVLFRSFLRGFREFALGG